VLLVNHNADVECFEKQWILMGVVWCYAGDGLPGIRMIFTNIDPDEAGKQYAAEIFVDANGDYIGMYAGAWGREGGWRDSAASEYWWGSQGSLLAQ
jgi:hypothetical protein